MAARLARLIACVVLLGFVAALGAQTPVAVTVHEWGTFTSIAGPDGKAMQWLPLGGPTDLPCFVRTYENRMYKVMMPPNVGELLDYEQARSGLKGSVRMETPVIYFYASQPTAARVSVSFPRGLFTEYYPKADVRQSPSYQNILNTPPGMLATITWPTVNIQPGAKAEFPSDRDGSHYYAARETDAAPVRVYGEEEKFLFYRGVAGFDVPISTSLQDDGRVVVKNLSSFTMPRVILFVKRDGKIGFRVEDGLASMTEVTMAPPALTGTMPALRQELERTLVESGLYPREARAMVETWRDDWFNDGTRVFYAVPSQTTDAILPLQISPAPAAIVRSFIGRMEVITPESIAAVERALAAGDTRLLEAYGRWLSPIGERVLAKTTSADARAALTATLNRIFRSYLARVTACQ
jgi:hypothetical protein